MEFGKLLASPNGGWCLGLSWIFSFWLLLISFREQEMLPTTNSGLYFFEKAKQDFLDLLPETASSVGLWGTQKD